MKRRLLIAQALMSSASAVIFTSTGWLMGTRTLRMPDPTPFNSPGMIYTGPQKITCIGQTGCNRICQSGYAPCPPYNPPPYWIWYGCTNENPPCSSGYCSFESDPQSITCQ